MTRRFDLAVCVSAVMCAAAVLAGHPLGLLGIAALPLLGNRRER